MNLVSIRVISDDVAGMADFYENITGGTVVRPNEQFAEVRTGAGTLAIGSTATVNLFGPGSARPNANQSAIVEFLVDDVDAEYVRLREFVSEFVREPTLMPWGNKTLLFRDPDGNLVNFFTPITPEAVAKFERAGATATRR